ncbi:hypothetical protein B0H14DRAFT_2648405 [Mycena olivaceomarginata]|nr:hypothetical protein B0H14DRAFT_2648405 [Mycena olivaceomarginata]
MVPPSETEEAAASTAPRTRSRKRTVWELSESETSDAPVEKLAKKKPGPKPKSRPAKSAAPLKKPKKTAALEPTSDSEVSDVEPVIKPKSSYKHLCYVRAVDGYGGTEKKKNAAAIEYDSDGIEVVPNVGMVFMSLVDSLNETAPEIVFMIPEATSDGNQRVALQSSQSFEDVVEIMHETIGCVSVTRKPTLAYKMSSAGHPRSFQRRRSTARLWLDRTIFVSALRCSGCLTLR